MKDIVETCAGRELEAVSDVVDDGRHPIGSIETGPEFPFGRHLQGGWSAVTQAQPDLIAHGIAGFMMNLVVVALVDSLGQFQAGTGVFQELVAFRHGLGHRRHPCFTRLV